MKKNVYGIELILDLYDCNIKKFNEKDLREFIDLSCELAKMNKCGDPVFWTNNSPKAHLNGISVLQFIETSNILLHTLNKLQRVYINFFSCKKFDTEIFIKFSSEYFESKKNMHKVIERL